MADKSHTFAEAAASHIENGGEARYLPRIVEYFGDRPLAEVFPFDLRQMAKALYPGRSNATLNRQALAPARAVMIHAYERGWCGPMRLRRFREDTPKRREPASPTWLHAFARQCMIEGKPQLAALVLLMATTGARVTEAINLRWREVDLRRRSILLVKTKTDTNSPRTLTDEMVDRLAALQEGAALDDRVFGYRCRQSVNARIRKACERAGISYKPSHTCGRHSFANNTLELGLDIKTVMHAGGWRSSAVFLGVYARAHPNAGRVVADRLSHYEYRTDI
ncbi:site-specific integrase [Shinella yambaruensis]|uniref:Tyr recombinase domain-containing protein n=1 Tax=Shinella yambaruensis TaxID=415996 RepID=A0ABQ5ZWX7_9HYPH|nr:tyrosine-type recombinase/integrase [Shinella yambaruensis]MCJ8029992.1 site-specific integrase [Shinella yambaruensis]MCU7984284.1 site-specific integrase [Shinella yambaruensis]GLR55113.1 hypothetical protein GCM10007923_63340 [Shinella yambaruensis]